MDFEKIKEAASGKELVIYGESGDDDAHDDKNCNLHT